MAGSISLAAANITDDDASDDACAIVDDAGPNGASDANDDIATEAAFVVDDAIISRRCKGVLDVVDVVVVYAQARD